MFNSPSRPASSSRGIHPAARPSSVHASRANTPTIARTSSPAKGSSTTARQQGKARANVVRRREVYDEHFMLVGSDDGDEDQLRHRISLPAMTVLKKNKMSAVTVHSELPREVVEALESADPYVDACSGGLDILTEYGILITSSKTIVWSLSNRKSSFTTCYTFSSPQSSTSQVHALPYASLVPRTAGREPGFLLVSVHGALRFWDSITSSLSGAEPGGAGIQRYQSLDVALGSTESVINLQRCDAGTFALATSHGRLFRISIQSSGGRLQAQLTQFNQQRGIFGRLFGGNGGGGVTATASGIATGSEGVIALAPCPPLQGQGSIDLYAVGHRVFQKWKLLDSGGERLLHEQDIGHLLAPLIVGEQEVEASRAADAINLEIIDAAANSDGSLRVLYSFARQTNKPLTYGVASLTPGEHGTYVVEEDELLDHRALRDPRPYTTPRLALPNGGPAYFVIFVDTIVIGLSRREISSSAAVQEQIVLKDSVRYRLLGHGCEGAEVDSAASIAAITCLAAQSGTLLIEFDIVAAQNFSQRLEHPAQRLAALNERLQDKVEQAVFFDKGLVNPLSFSISDASTLEGDLPTVVESISSSILNSSSANLQSFVDLREHLADRLDTLVKLASVIKSNDLWRLVPHRSRCHLAADAELLAAAVDLWAYHNDVVNFKHSVGDVDGLVSTPLSDAIGDVMAGLGLGFGGDAVRMFFRSSLVAISGVFEHLLTRLRASDGIPLELRGEEIAEINRVAMTAFQAAFRYKQASVDLYGLGKGMSHEAWTCRMSSVQLLESLYIATEALIRDRTRELGTIVDVDPSTAFDTEEDDPTATQQATQVELKTQLCELARYTLASYEEQISYLTSDDTLGREQAAFAARFRAARPKLLHPLVSIGRLDRALALAERHSDFRTLAELCLDPISSPLLSSHIQRYLRQYQSAFAFELYQHYIEQNRYKELLQQDAEWGDLLLEFFQATDNASISWLHDLALQRYHDASQTLLEEATREDTLKSKNVLLSLGKLSYVAELSEDQIATEEEQGKIQMIDDQLDLISIHEKLLGLFARVVPVRGPQDAASQAEHVVAALCQSLASNGQEALLVHFKGLVERLLQGRILSSEDLIDLLTLKDSGEEHLQDFSTALETCVRGNDLQEARLDLAVTSIWRRAILHDDWHSISNTTSVSDEDLWFRLDQTAYYRSLHSVYSTPHLSHLAVPLEDLTRAPKKEVLLARFDRQQYRRGGHQEGEDERDLATPLTGGVGAAQVQVLYTDLESEVSRVDELVRGETGKWIEEAARRARRTAAEEEDEGRQGTGAEGMYD